MSRHGDESPAGKAMDEAMELAIQERSPYPDRVAFIDADTPGTDRRVREAAAEGRAVVLVAADGSTRVLHPELAAG